MAGQTAMVGSGVAVLDLLRIILASPMSSLEPQFSHL